MKTAREIRQKFIQYFENQGHKVVPSAPIVVKDDPTLMFTNAGMNQFKDLFLGNQQATSPRVADTQKCLRASGKHNDLEEVGHDTYHHTMFEMLGNWSFGDYYKKEAIEWAWDLLTNQLGIDPERMYVTVFEGDATDGLELDSEATDEWKKWIAPDRILQASKKDNFWEMGATGPCGPCSEIHVDVRSEEERAKVDGKTLVNEDHPEVIEIWNLVFMEFNRQEDGSLIPLPDKHVDTGMGFERLCMVLQGAKSTYDTDIFTPIKSFLETELGAKYGRSEEEDIAMRVVMDHIRAVTFAIADGQIPSTNKAGYVIRRILRRATRYAFQYLNHSRPFLYRLVPTMASIYKGVFPEVERQQEFISRIIQAEEVSFLRTLEKGIQQFEKYTEDKGSGDKTIDGDFAFKLYDAQGFPLDLTQLMAREQGYSVDEERFNVLMKEQRLRGKDVGQIKMGDWVEVAPMDVMPVFHGYDQLETTCSILRYRTLETKDGKAYQVVIDHTPFYSQSGGQVGDSGELTNGFQTLKVLDTKKENDLIVHFIDQLPSNAEGEWTAKVDANLRRLIKANHSATHLVHAALRDVLGNHVEQRGSLVSEKILRFDFSHFSRMTAEELKQVEDQVNEKIAASIPLEERRNVPIEEAKAAGAMALFGEKYGDSVRMIVFDPAYSVELCGGTHVANTQEIRYFKILSESSSAAGIRRIEAVTSDAALAYMADQLDLLNQVAAVLKDPRDLVKSVSDLVEKSKILEKELAKLAAEKVGDLKGSLEGKAIDKDGFKLINQVVEVPSANDLKGLAFDLGKSMDKAVILLGAKINDKPLLNIVITEELLKDSELNAGQLIREVAKAIQGGGGGQPHFASAGGKNVDGLQAAMDKIEELV